MRDADIFAEALKSIEQGQLSLDLGDAPERYLWAARHLFDLDPQKNERVLLARAQESDVCERQKYIYALTYFGGIKGNFFDETFDFLIGLCERLTEDAESREAAGCALSWSGFENISDRNLDRVVNCLQRMTSERPTVLSAKSLQHAKARLKSLEEVRAVFRDFLAGRIVVPDEITRDLLSIEGADSLTGLGYSQANVDGLVRAIVLSSRWLWGGTRKRRTRACDFYEVGTELVGLTGKSSVSLSVIWKLDRRTKQKTVSASYLGVPGSRPELIPSRWPWRRTQ